MNGIEIIRSFLESSPLVVELGIKTISLESDTAELTLPFDQKIVTIGDVVHGGAIATLIDTTAMAAAWCTDQVPDSPRGTTVSLSVNFIAPARGQDVSAVGRVARRGKQLVFCDVEAKCGGETVATAIVTYKLG